MSNQSLLVENCIVISATYFGSALARIRKRGNINDSLDISHGNKKITINFWSEYRENEACLVIAINGLESQEILLIESELMFGTRTYFVCDCGRRSFKLYLPPNSTEFKCRKCHNLKYELSAIN